MLNGQPIQRVKGRQLTDYLGITAPEQGDWDWGDPVAYAADVATDPLTYASFGVGALAKLMGRGAKAARAATPTARVAEAMSPLADDAARMAMPAVESMAPRVAADAADLAATRWMGGMDMPMPASAVPSVPKLPQPPLALPAPVPAFYSRLERAAETLPENVKAQSIPNLLAKAPEGVAPEEIGWVLGELPKAGKVAKRDLIEKIGNNRIRLDETLLGDGNAATRFDKYRTPGGEQYRELLLKLPRQAEVHEVIDEGVKIMEKAIAEGRQLSGKEAHRVRELRSLAQSLGDRPTNYQSSHWGWDEHPNVLAHVRFDERLAPDGTRTLFVHEVQSDLHQAGRRAGYTVEENIARKAEAKAKHDALHSDMRSLIRETTDVAKREGNFGFDNPREAVEAILGGKFDKSVYAANPPLAKAAAKYNALNEDLESLAKAWAVIKEGPVADLPFKNDAWADLALKRILQQATDNGFDRIAFNNGELAAKYAAGGAKGKDAKSLAYFYDEALPAKMQKLLGKKQARYDPIAIDVDGTQQIVPSFLISQEVKKKIASRGQPLLSLIPFAAAGGLAAQGAGAWGGAE